MIEVRFEHRSDRQPGHRALLLFGHGLIGREILFALRLGPFYLTERHHPFSWAEPELWSDELAEIYSSCRPSSGTEDTPRRIDIVWAAGRAGFGGTEAHLADELDAYRRVLDLANRLSNSEPPVQVVFHLISSAGGLFEGQRLVDVDTVPAPRRPYGSAKLAQEQALSAQGRIASHIYRPSSVYGFNDRSNRVGLISALISNGFRQRVSRIFGSYQTIRDYVYAADIGRYVAGQVFGDAAIVSRTHFLVSGKPSSILELLQFAKIATGRQLYLQLDPYPSNADNITFARNVMPLQWQPTDLGTGLQATARKIAVNLAQLG